MNACECFLDAQGVFPAGTKLLGNQGLESKEEYLAARGLSRSKLPYIEESWERFVYEINKPEGRKSDALTIGSFIHELILEPHKLGKYVNDKKIVTQIGGGNPRGTKAYKAWRGEQEIKGKTVLKHGSSAEYLQDGEVILDSVNENKLLKNVLAASVVELPMTAVVDGIRRKGCADIFFQSEDYDFIMDVKTIDQIITTEALEKYVADYECHVQAAWYQSISEELHGRPARFALVFVGKTYPYPVACLELDDEAIEMGHKEINRYVEMIRQGKRRKVESHLSKKLRLPDWKINQYGSRGWL